MRGSIEPCKSHRVGEYRCKDGHLQCGYCVNGKTGTYNQPMCINDDPPDHYMAIYTDDSGAPKPLRPGGQIPIVDTTPKQR